MSASVGGRVHKGWTELPSGTKGGGEDRQTDRRDSELPRCFERTEVSHQLRPLTVPSGHSGGSWRIHQERSVQKRSLDRSWTRRCDWTQVQRKSKVASLLGCRSHRWKMRTSCPSSSSGECRGTFVFARLKQKQRHFPTACHHFLGHRWRETKRDPCY